jgi:hypothetical protein
MIPSTIMATMSISQVFALCFHSGSVVRPWAAEPPPPAGVLAFTGALGCTDGLALAPALAAVLAFGEAWAFPAGALPFPEVFEDECGFAGAFGTAGNWITLSRAVDATAA